jgi:hypothetical protein
MTREHVMSVVKKHLLEAVDGLDAAAIEPTRSMKDLGANSLDIVEVVSRSELAKLTNIEGLVDTLYAAAGAAAEPRA